MFQVICEKENSDFILLPYLISFLNIWFSEIYFHYKTLYFNYKTARGR